MKKTHVIIFVVVAIILVAAIPVRIVTAANKIAHLCQLIENGENEAAIEAAKGIRDLNAPSTIFPRFVSFIEGKVTTPLVQACETGNAEMIVWLLEHGAKVDYAPGAIEYPLEIFCDNGTGAGTDALEKLLEYGADPELYRYRPPLFRLMQTLRHRSDETYDTGVEMTLLLLDKGAKWRDPKDGFTVFHFAAMQRNTDFLKALLERDQAADYINMKDDEGQTPLDIAEKFGNTECARILQEAGA